VSGENPPRRHRLGHNRSRERRRPGSRTTLPPVTPTTITGPDDHWSFPWWLFGILVASPVSIVVGLVLGVVVVWQRKRIQLWAWRLRGRFR